MGTSLTGLTPATTYDALIKVGDNGPLSATAKVLSDGLGNDSPLAMSTSNVGIGTSSPICKLDVGGDSPQIAINRSSGNDPKLSFNASGSEYGSIISNASSGENRFSIGPSIAWGGFHTFYTDTTEKARITSDGKVGIGTTTPTTKLMVEGTGSFGTTSNEVRLQNGGTFVSSTLNAHIINSDGTGAYNSGNLLIQPRCSSGAGVTDIIFATSNNTNTPTERFRITANGVTFNGDTAAANALDDYEEGTWTMGISFGGASTGVTYSTNQGTYTKIGRQVTVNGYVLLTSKGSSTGSATITGLPFTIGNSVAFSTSASLWMRKISFTDQFQAIGTTANTTISMWEVTNGGTLSALDDTNFANDSDIVLSLTYFV